MERVEAEIALLIREFKATRGEYITLGSVESATGGRIADKITDIAGSSDYFIGTIVSYSNEAKIKIAGVSADTLKAHGAVSMETACEMAGEGRKLLNVDICVSTTGIAGPGGATAGKPVGLFYIGLSTTQKTGACKHVFSGNRERVKKKATEAALEVLRGAVIEFISGSENIRLDEKHVVTCFLEHNGLILLLRRSGKVGTYQKIWAGISGYIETDAVDQAYIEISEETALYKRDIRLVRAGEPIDILDVGLHMKWVVHPFLFKIRDPGKIKTDWEHTEHRWIKPDAITRYKTVPGLKQALDTVWP
jgi:PncC family amidohydrolase